MAHSPTALAHDLLARLQTLPWHVHALIGGIFLLIVMVYTMRWQRRWMRWRYESKEARRARRAAQAEVDAEILLRAQGYRVVSSQTEHVWPVYLDGDPHDVTMRADFIVSRRGKTYIAEVKSGNMAPSITTAATRRQLLEYRLAYPVDGILLVDMEALEIFEVTFEFEKPSRQPLKWVASGMVLGVLSAVGVFGVLGLM